MNSKTKALLMADAGSVVARHPSLRLVMKDGCPVKIVGNYVVMDDEGRPQGDFYIEMGIPAGYPYAFPVLKETSGKIPATDDRHMSDDRVACVENPRQAVLVQRKGISLTDFVLRYVHPYFCWQLVAEVDGVAGLPAWGHQSAGIVEFYRNFCGTEDGGMIRRLLSLAIHPNHLARNAPCQCGSGKKFKRCHLEQVETLALFGTATLRNDLRLFGEGG